MSDELTDEEFTELFTRAITDPIASEELRQLLNNTLGGEFITYDPVMNTMKMEPGIAHIIVAEENESSVTTKLVN